jgi:hypothetical protein
MGLDMDAWGEDDAAYAHHAIQHYGAVLEEIQVRRAREEAGVDRLLGAFETVQSLLDNPRLNAPALAELKARGDYLQGKLRALGFSLPGDEAGR